MADLEEEQPFTLRAYIQTLTRISKPQFEEKGSTIEDWVGLEVIFIGNSILNSRFVPFAPTRSHLLWVKRSAATQRGHGEIANTKAGKDAS